VFPKEIRGTPLVKAHYFRNTLAERCKNQGIFVLFIYLFTLYLLGTCRVPIVYHGERKIMQPILKNKMLAKTFWAGGGRRRRRGRG
jgi:hypothetical protein